MKAYNSFFLSILFVAPYSAIAADKAVYPISMATRNGQGSSRSVSLSKDGRYLAFESDAPNLVAGDTNRLTDVFVYDTQLEIRVRVSVSSSGGEGNGASFHPKISGDGKFVVFASNATNLIPSDFNGKTDIFIRDLQAGTTTRVSTGMNGLEANGNSDWPSISDDGAIIGFITDATNLYAFSDTNDHSDYIVHFMNGRSNVLASVSSADEPGNDDVIDGQVSPDGNFVVFTSKASNLVPGDTNGCADVFLRSLIYPMTELISQSDEGVIGDRSSSSAAISLGGQFVVFESRAGNLVASDSNGYSDIFLKDRFAAKMERVSLMESTSSPLSFPSHSPTISDDGRFIAFHATSTGFGSLNSNTYDNIFIRDRDSEITKLVTSISSGIGLRWSRDPFISRDGHQIGFISLASNLTLPPEDSETRFSDVFYRPNSLLQQPVGVSAIDILSDDGGRQQAFKFTRTGRSNTALAVQYLVSGTATAGGDYEALSGEIIIPAGSESVILEVNVYNGAPTVGETVDIGVIETPYVIPNGLNSHAIAEFQHVYPYTVSMSSIDAQAVEGVSDKGVVRVCRDLVNSSPLIVWYSISGTAINGVDYQSLANSVTILPNQSCADIEVLALTDVLNESFESVSFDLSSSVAYTIGGNRSATVIIRDPPCSAVAAEKCDFKLLHRARIDGEVLK